MQATVDSSKGPVVIGLVVYDVLGKPKPEYQGLEGTTVDVSLGEAITFGVDAEVFKLGADPTITVRVTLLERDRAQATCAFRAHSPESAKRSPPFAVNANGPVRALFWLPDEVGMHQVRITLRVV